MIKIENCEALTGKVLLATPGFSNFKFDTSVVYICGHDKNGAFGIILNKRIKSLSLDNLLCRMSNSNAKSVKHDDPLYFGGPVEVGRGFVLHSMDRYFDSTVRISANIGLTSTVDILNAILDKTGPEKYIISIGFIQWASGELEHEVEQSYWVVSKCDDRFVFDIPPEEKRERLMGNIGIKGDMNMLSISGHA